MGAIIYFLYFFSLSVAGLKIGNLKNPSVQTPLGAIRGKNLQTKTGKEYAAFEGIPYAKSPIKKYRFREPRPIRSYHGTVEARFQRICLQYNHYAHAVIGEEDCLVVNVYSPQLNSTSLLPVVIHIHGGAFMFGSSYVYGQHFLMDRNVVYVTFNYRLGPLGFLSTEDAVLPGNNGMKDQVLAIKWIFDNIKYFGGDASKITLTGMSAGGASVHLHYLSPLSTGLFSKGFSLSGTALNPWVLQENPREKVIKLATIMDCPTKNGTRAIVNCLTYIPARNIVEVVPQFFGYMNNPFSPFGPVVEPTGTINAFLPEHPYDMLKQGKIKDLPWITSVVQSEGLYPGAEFWADPQTLSEIESRWFKIAPHVLDYNYTLDRLLHSDIATKIKQTYLKNNKISKSTYLQLIQVLSDRLFIVDAQNAAKLHATTVSSPVHFYYFTYRGAHSKSEALSKCNENFGASHGDDVIYVLSSDVNITTTDSDKKMSQVLIDLWMSYANDGVPTLLNSTWDAVSSNVNDVLNFVEIQSPSSIIKQSKDFDNVEFWNNLPLKENHNLFLEVKDEF